MGAALPVATKGIYLALSTGAIDAVEFLHRSATAPMASKRLLAITISPASTSRMERLKV